MRHKMINNLLLLLTALIWGSAFVAQSVGMDYIGPFTFNCVRSVLGGIVLMPVIWIMGRQKKNDHNDKSDTDYKTLLTGGICCGIALAAASSLQQIGLVYTSAGKAGFITALYIVIVPVMGLFLGKKTGVRTWIGVALAAVTVFPLHYRWLYHIHGGPDRPFVCSSLLDTYPADRSLLSEGGWSATLLHSVLRKRNPVRCPYADRRTATDWRNTGSLAAPALCGCPFQRRSLYPPDHSTEKH